MEGLQILKEADVQNIQDNEKDLDISNLMNLKIISQVFLRVNNFIINEPDFREYMESEFITYFQKNTNQEILKRFEDLNIEENFRSSMSNVYSSKDGGNKIFIFFLPTSRQKTKVGVEVIKLFCRLTILLGCKEGVIISEQSLSPASLEQLESSNIKTSYKDDIYNVISYMDDMFINVVDHCLSPKVLKIYSGEELDHLLKTEKISRAELPRMSEADPIAKFYRAKSGDVIKMKRKTGNKDTLINEQIVFRSVIHNNAKKK